MGDITSQNTTGGAINMVADSKMHDETGGRTRPPPRRKCLMVWKR